MRRQDFSYQLPNELIAKYPPDNRTDSRLLVLDGDSGQIGHHQFRFIENLVQAGDLLVFNNTRVIPARVFGHKESGGKIEILIERVLDSHRVMAQIRASKSPKTGTTILLEDGTPVFVATRNEDMYRLTFPEHVKVLDVLEKIGHMPLPPYIDRPAAEGDRERYQTVYGDKPGAVAAPTAGLHFDQALIHRLKAMDVQTAFVTLHVGAGTFQPLRVENIREHKMHAELMEISQQVCDQVMETKRAGKRVIAVGTTSVRCLETAAASGTIQPYQGETNIFIYPSFEYRVTDALITNFHLPESTLLMLVCAFAGYTNTMTAYRMAVAKQYRFFSYGDAMFITRNNLAHVELPN